MMLCMKCTDVHGMTRNFGKEMLQTMFVAVQRATGVVENLNNIKSHGFVYGETVSGAGIIRSLGKNCFHATIRHLEVTRL